MTSAYYWPYKRTVVFFPEAPLCRRYHPDLFIVYRHTTHCLVLDIFQLRQHVGSERCLDVSSDLPSQQILQVIKHFHIHVKEEDIFSRCQVRTNRYIFSILRSLLYIIRRKVCNCNRFHRLHRKQLAGPELADEAVGPPSPTIKKSWLLVEAPQSSQNKVTSKGIGIQIDQVPEGVILAHQFFYICVDCGKCYWGIIIVQFFFYFKFILVNCTEGSHLNKILDSGSLKNVLDWSRNDMKWNAFSINGLYFVYRIALLTT